MNVHLQPDRSPVLVALRDATTRIHERLEARLDAMPRLADPASRPTLIARYADLHIPADDVLGAALGHLEELDMPGRRRTSLARFAAARALPAFPSPAGTCEALGMLYVLEGSTLGGRMILRQLAARGVRDDDLGFLDPYGRETGARWRVFLAVLAREAGEDAGRIDDACRGGRRAFAHAERVLCGEADDQN